jgi:AcrR family transcriptional regulator
MHVARRRLTREESRARTRERLLESAAAVFAERGFHGAAVEEIAERAGYTRGAFYSNFSDKDDVFLALLDRRFALALHEVADIMRRSESAAEVLAQLRERSARRGVDESWLLLYTEFQLYAIRNPRVRPKLAARARAERDALASAVGMQFERAGFELPASQALTGLIMQILDRGCDVEHLLDPEGVPSTAYFEALTLLYESGIALARARAAHR